MKISSMTGFARGQAQLSQRFAVGIALRSVNHRYLDIQVRHSLREEMPELDAAVREEVSRVTERGRITVQVNLQRLTAAESAVVVDRDGFRNVLHQLRGLGGEDDSENEVRVGDLLSIPGLVAVCSSSVELDAAEIAALRRLMQQVAADFLDMRRSEGAQLACAIREELERVVAFVDWFEPQQDRFRDQIHARLTQRIGELLGGAQLDEERLVHEAALLADKADVAEEVVRLRAHVESFERRLAGGGVIGRALDFLCQELHRELNTLGTKCREVGIADRVVDAKGAVEKIREQVQNIE